MHALHRPDCLPASRQRGCVQCLPIVPTTAAVVSCRRVGRTSGRSQRRPGLPLRPSARQQPPVPRAVDPLCPALCANGAMKRSPSPLAPEPWPTGPGKGADGRATYAPPTLPSLLSPRCALTPDEGRHQSVVGTQYRFGHQINAGAARFLVADCWLQQNGPTLPFRVRGGSSSDRCACCSSATEGSASLSVGSQRQHSPPSCATWLSVHVRDGASIPRPAPVRVLSLGQHARPSKHNGRTTILRFGASVGRRGPNRDGVRSAATAPLSPMVPRITSPSLR